mmetsp:Transcript_129194/g.413017  ORF Transcript_129194/g.413017 Transcript_129194/m.413017 type:complete len:96 (-) Transcript_129194:270-557(-)
MPARDLHKRCSTDWAAPRRRSVASSSLASARAWVFFASKVTFGPNGIEQVHPIGPLSKKEQELLVEVKKSLAADIEAGLKYAEGVELAKGGGDAR